MTFTAIKKSSHTWQKFLNEYDVMQLQNQQFINKTTLHERKFSRELLVFSKGVLKNFANFLFFSGFCRILKNTFPLEHSWASASDFIFDIFKSNKYMKVSFLLTVFYRKSKIKQKSRVALKLGNLRFALQWSSSFVELLLSSC